MLPKSDQHDTAYAIDGMALIQALDETQFDSFDDLGLKVIQIIHSVLGGRLSVTSVTLVFDRYDASLSIKQQKRERRTCGESTPFMSSVDTAKFPTTDSS